MTVTTKKKNNKTKVVEEASTVNRGAINYHCDYCQVDIVDHRIRCNECEEFDLCVFCFSHGVEIAGHKRNHSYSIIKKHTFPIFDEKWGADEELLLIEALEMYGIGAWADCAEYLGSKTKDECRDHYINTYLKSEICPLPDTTKNFDPEIDTTLSRKYYKAGVAKNKVWASQPSNHDVQGFMPGRLEFETEYDNEGENAIKEIAFHEDDHPEEVEFKLALLDSYNNKLNKREYRKRFLTLHNLTEYKKNQAIDKKRSREGRQIYNGLKVFARLQSPDDYKELCQGLIKEEQIKNQILKLQEYKKNGLSNFEEVEEFESAKSVRSITIKPSLPKDRNTSFVVDKAVLSHSAIKWPDSTAPAVNIETVEKQRTIGRKAIQPLDISGAEGIELLLPDEIQLCSALRLYPKTYLSIKETLIKECATRGSLRRRQARELIKIDVNKTARVYDFLSMMGWVRAHPQT
ncbi:hypothetical protein K502DRAFT_368933 [Neoconidiobolus thromboides FSU 785]|nr:hypothetical protein K502DRAFT_368933 [Neoconidiobolus thromboides FSU 785]